MRFILFYCVAFLFFHSTTAKTGGELEINFKSCLSKCQNVPCDLSFCLSLFQWSCLDDCKYTCMYQIVNERKEQSLEIRQYYGKWPFYRVCGVQEPASVLFSMLNFWVHYKGYKKIIKHVSFVFPMRRYLVFVGLFGMNAWIWSCLFHARDTIATERADYFAAMASILMSSYQGMTRVFRVYKSRGMQYGLGCIYVLFFVIHVSYLTFWKFDYGYNMIAGVVIGLGSNLTWCVWALLHWKEREYARKIVYAFILLLLAITLEVFDFPAVWGVIDAHSLWHLATVPITALIYDFMICDAQFETTSMLDKRRKS